MGRNEIRLRRHMMSAGRIAQHRNYGDLMARHEREMRLKRIVRVFIYFLIILFFIIVFFMVKYWEEKQHEKKLPPSDLTTHITGNNHHFQWYDVGVHPEAERQ